MSSFQGNSHVKLGLQSDAFILGILRLLHLEAITFLLGNKPRGSGLTLCCKLMGRPEIISQPEGTAAYYFTLLTTQHHGLSQDDEVASSSCCGFLSSQLL